MQPQFKFSRKIISSRNAFWGLTRSSGFTLAEVLITLGIIGIVAAMTMPALIQKYRRAVVETSLKKFYTNINQAIKLSVVENGETRYWTFIEEDDKSEDFYNKYIKKHVKTLKTDTIVRKDDGKRRFVIYFADGSGASLTYGGHDWNYCINAKDLFYSKMSLGKSCFAFGFYPTTNEHAYSKKHYNNKGMEPFIPYYIKDEDGKIIYQTDDNKLYEAKAYTAIIQKNGWRIPDDYPFKF